jgi:hypothetical protein
MRSFWAIRVRALSLTNRRGLRDDETALPDSATRALIGGSIASEIAKAYPRFVKQVFPDAA